MIRDRIEYRRRPGRTSSTHVTTTWFARTAIADGVDSPQLRTILADPERFLASPGVRILKASRRSTVGVGRMGDRRVVVKRTNPARTWRTALRRAFSPSRAARAWVCARRLAELDIPTAPLLAYAERRLGPLRRGSCQVMAYLDGTDALTYLADPAVSEGERERAVDGIAALVERLHHAGISHRDNRLQNFILVDGVPHIIDLDSMHRHTRWSPVRRRYMEGDWRQLSANLRRRFPELGERFARLACAARGPRAAT